MFMLTFLPVVATLGGLPYAAILLLPRGPLGAAGLGAATALYGGFVAALALRPESLLFGVRDVGAPFIFLGVTLVALGLGLGLLARAVNPVLAHRRGWSTHRTWLVGAGLLVVLPQFLEAAPLALFVALAVAGAGAMASSWREGRMDASHPPS